VKAVYIGHDRIARVEDLSPHHRLAEFHDGQHPVTGITAHARRDGPAAMVIWAGISMPEGAIYDKKKRDELLLEVDVCKVNRQRVLVSKVWHRRLVRAWRLFYRTSAVIFTAAFATLLLLVFA